MTKYVKPIKVEKENKAVINNEHPKESVYIEKVTTQLEPCLEDQAVCSAPNEAEKHSSTTTRRSQW